MYRDITMIEGPAEFLVHWVSRLKRPMLPNSEVKIPGALFLLYAFSEWSFGIQAALPLQAEVTVLIVIPGLRSLKVITTV